jgi:ribosomal-protein-alanine N-acetyltransferase
VTVIVFETPRLLGRRLEPQDLEPMLAVYGDLEAMRFVGDGTALSREECERWLAVTADNYAKRGYGMFALVERQSGRVVGFGGLIHFAGRGEPEIKYALLRSAWGRGLATEAARALLDFARARGLPEVIATVDPQHGASQRVLAKAGMERGEIREEDDGSQTQMYYWPSAPR